MSLYIKPKYKKAVDSLSTAFFIFTKKIIMKFKILLLLSFFFLLNACGDPAPKEATTATIEKNVPDFFQKVLDAHGGLDQWNKMNTLKFSGSRSEPPTDYVVDLKTRKETIEVSGKYVLGNDGEKVWITPARDSFPGKSPRFMKNLVFYFVAVPFVFADDGVILEQLDNRTLNEKEYQVIKATFGNGVGDAPEDQYLMYVNPSTHIVEYLNYSVTYFDKARATKYNAMGYTWKKVNGLLFPEKYIGYKWENDELGEVRYESPFANISFSEERMDAGTFAVPEGAYVE